VTQMLEVIPFPVPKLRRALLESLVCRAKVIRQHFAVSQGNAIDVKVSVRPREGLFRPAPLVFGPAPLPDYARKPQQCYQADQGSSRGGRGPAPHPLRCSLPPPHRSCPDRFTCPPALQILSQGLGGGVALFRYFFEAFPANGFQVAAHLGVNAPKPL